MAEIAGWENGWGDWQNTEKGDPMPSEWELSYAEQIVVHWTNEAGEDIYRTLSGGFEDWESLADAIGDLMEEY